MCRVRDCAEGGGKPLQDIGWRSDTLESELLGERCVCRLWNRSKGGKSGSGEVGQEAAVIVRRRDDGGLD